MRREDFNPGGQEEKRRNILGAGQKKGSGNVARTGHERYLKT